MHRTVRKVPALGSDGSSGERFSLSFPSFFLNSLFFSLRGLPCSFERFSLLFLGFYGFGRDKKSMFLWWLRTGPRNGFLCVSTVHCLTFTGARFRLWGRFQKNGCDARERAQNTDFRRQPQILGDSPLPMEIQAFGGRRQPQRTAAFCRKPKIFAENRRKPQIGLCHLRSFTLSSALETFARSFSVSNLSLQPYDV